MNGPAPVLVELAEALVGMIPHAAWCLFQKNGTDATTACVTIARAATGRRKVLVARGAYHGAAPWCTPSLAGVTPEDCAHFVHFDYNDAASLEAAAEAAQGDLAAVLVTAFRHDIGRDLEMPDPAFARAARDLRRRRRGAGPRRRPRGLPPAPRRLLGGDRRAAGPLGLQQGDRQRPRPGRGDRRRAEAGTDEFNCGTAAIGTGPFRLVSHTPGVATEFARHDGYWGDAPEARAAW